MMNYDSFIVVGELQIYSGLGLVCMNGQLFKLEMKKFLRHFRNSEELLASLNEITAYKVCKSVPFLLNLMKTQLLSGTIGSYTLFFGSNWRGRTGLFQNSVVFDKFLPCWKTCLQCVMQIQRYTKRRIRNRKILPFVMGLHRRVGNASVVEMLGSDLTEKICSMLY
jgi:hypothetical protein